MVYFGSIYLYTYPRMSPLSTTAAPTLHNLYNNIIEIKNAHTKFLQGPEMQQYDEFIVHYADKVQKELIDRLPARAVQVLYHALQNQRHDVHSPDEIAQILTKKLLKTNEQAMVIELTLQNLFASWYSVAADVEIKKDFAGHFELFNIDLNQICRQPKKNSAGSIIFEKQHEVRKTQAIKKPRFNFHYATKLTPAHAMSMIQFADLEDYKSTGRIPDEAAHYFYEISDCDPHKYYRLGDHTYHSGIAGLSEAIGNILHKYVYDGEVSYYQPIYYPYQWLVATWEEHTQFNKIFQWLFHMDTESKLGQIQYSINAPL